MNIPFNEIISCRLCLGKNLKNLIHFDNFLPAGLYTYNPIDARIPLTICQCTDCEHVQLKQTISNEIYSEYLYSSGISQELINYLQALSTDLINTFQLKDKKILEIGSSDGTFLKYFVDQNHVTGIEPSKHLTDVANNTNQVNTINGYFNSALITEKQDFVICRHVLEHVDNLNDFISEISEISGEDAYLLIEVPSLEETVGNKIYSNFFHEHLNYFSLQTLVYLLNSHNFNFISSYTNSIHGGSIGVIFQKSNSRENKNTQNEKLKCDVPDFFENMLHYLKCLKKGLSGNHYIGYGAAHRTSFLISALDLIDKIDFLVDKNSSYFGKYIGGTNIQILPLDYLYELNNKSIILFALSYESEILRENIEITQKNNFISIKTSEIRTISYLDIISSNIRQNILGMNASSRASHTGSALSIVDILTVLYFKVLNVTPQNFLTPNHDKFILSKGHASAALYATLSEKGFFDKSLLSQFYCDDGALPGHLDKNAVPGIEVSSGSLGHGLSLAIGMALANKIDDNSSKVFVICGDGELNEGSVWEAIMFAPHKQLNNLTLIIDYNKFQGYGETNEVINLEPINEKFKAFNWEVIQIDGHKFVEIETALNQPSIRPKAIIAHTIKGKGISFMENQFIWHYKSPDDEQLKTALSELI